MKLITHEYVIYDGGWVLEWRRKPTVITWQPLEFVVLVYLFFIVLSM